jgi:hypothetical protein
MQNVHNFICFLDRINWINWIFLPCVPFPDERLNGQPPAEKKEQSAGHQLMAEKYVVIGD